MARVWLKPPSLYLALVVFGILVIVDAYQQNVACVFGNLLRIITILYLADGCLCIFIVFQFNNKCW